MPDDNGSRRDVSAHDREATVTSDGHPPTNGDRPNVFWLEVWEFKKSFVQIMDSNWERSVGSMGPFSGENFPLEMRQRGSSPHSARTQRATGLQYGGGTRLIAEELPRP
jgi:hypothetical protein